MFGAKKKKDAPRSTAQGEQSEEYRAFAAQFQAEEVDLLAVTGAAGAGSDPLGDTGLWKVTIGVSAWMDVYEKQVHREDARLETVVDDTLREYLLARLPRDFILSVTARPGAEGAHVWMTDLPTPGFDPELKAILDEQKKPVTFQAEGLGTFALNRALGWFEAGVDWRGRETTLLVDRAEEGRDAALDTARALLEAQEDWDERIRACAADALLDEAARMCAEEGGQELSREDFLAQLEPDSILVGPEGAFESWLGGDGFFLAHPVHVTGCLERGPERAEWEG